MKNFFILFIVLLFASFVNSCSVSSSFVAGSTYGNGTGVSYDYNVAKSIATANACAEASRGNDISIEENVKSVYTSRDDAGHKREGMMTTRTVTMKTGARFSNPRIKTITKRRNAKYNSTATVTINNDNIQSEL